jgi:hypothetical protein
MTKSRRMRWARHVTHMREKLSVYRLLVGKREGKRQLGGLDVDGSIKLKWI